MNILLQGLQTLLLCSALIVMVYIPDKFVGMKSGYRWRKVLWLVLAIRLLMPVSILPEGPGTVLPQVELKVSLSDMNSASYFANLEKTEKDGLLTETENTAVTQNAEAQAEEVTETENFLSQESVTPVRGISLLQLLLIGWAGGAVAALFIRLVQYRVLKKGCLEKASVCTDKDVLTLCNSIRREMNLRGRIAVMQGEDIKSPMVLGYFRKILLLPDKKYEKYNLEIIVRHELQHIKTGDLWYKLLMVVVCDVYWFNPVLQLMKKMAFQDVEYVCDERVTAKMNPAQKAEYGNAILETVAGRKEKGMSFTTKFAANKKQVKNRLENIFSGHNRKAGITMFTTLLLMLVLGTACVSVQPKENNATGADVQNTQENKAGQELPDDTGNGSEEDSVGQDVSGQQSFAVDAYILSEEEVLKEFEANYPQYAVEKVEDFDYASVVDGTGEMPVMWEANSNQVLALGHTGMVADLTDVLEQRGWLSQMNDSVRQYLADDEGHIYGIPDSLYAFGVVCNTELFEQAGLVDESGMPMLPGTWEEAARTAGIIKEKTGQAGLCLMTADMAGAWQFVNIAWSFGATDLCVANQDGTYTAHLDSKGAIEAMEFVKSLKWKYDALTEFPEKENYTTGYEHIGNGTAGMYISASDALYLPGMYGLEPDKIAFIAMPAGPGGEQYTMLDGGIIVFSAEATAEEIDAGLTMIEMMGMSPILNDAAKKHIDARIGDALNNNAPAIAEIPIWKNSERNKYESEILKQKSNVDMNLYQSFYDAVNVPGSLKVCDMPWLSAMYGELTTVLQAVVSDENADVAELMRQANNNYQNVLDTDK